MTSIQDIPVEILAIIFGFQPGWFLPILGLVNAKFHHAVKLFSSKFKLIKRSINLLKKKYLSNEKLGFGMVKAPIKYYIFYTSN